MDKTKKLDELFVQWEQKLKESKDIKIYNSVFIKDGIVDCDVFNKQYIKVLFVSNEANVGENFNCKNCDIRNEFDIYKSRQKDEYYISEIQKWQPSRGKMRERVCCLYQVVINDFSNKNTPYNVAKNFAFMNLNKTGGGAKIDKRIFAFCKEYKDEIKKEIDIISPDIIIWLGCNTFDNIELRTDLGVKEYKGKYYYNNIPVIRMWHTSYYQSKCEKLGVFDNEITDKLSKKLYDELVSIGWYDTKE